jgi:hypothetical protein
MKLIFWDGNVKPHAVADGLVEDIRVDIERRYTAPVLNVVDKDGQEMCMDRGGSMMVDAQWVDVPVEGSVFRVPVRDVQEFYIALLQARHRLTPSGQPYYKLHGWIHCIVFTPEQREAVLAAWADGMKEYVAFAEAEAVEFQRRMALLSQHPNIRVDPITYQSDRESENAAAELKAAGKLN